MKIGVRKELKDRIKRELGSVAEEEGDIAEESNLEIAEPVQWAGKTLWQRAFRDGGPKKEHEQREKGGAKERRKEKGKGKLLDT